MIKNYNEWWGLNKNSHEYHPSVRLRNDFIINKLKRIPFSNIIDIGCGNGKLLELIVNNFPSKKYFGLDISDSIVRENKMKLKNVNFFVHNIGEIINYNEKFDAVICSEVIEHVKNWKMVIKNLTLLTNNNGYIILTTQSGKKFKSDINIGHIKHFELFELENEFKKYGFLPIISYKKGWPFYNLQKLLYEKFENKAKNIQQGKLNLFSKIIFFITYLIFKFSIKSRFLGPQILLVLKKNVIN